MGWILLALLIVVVPLMLYLNQHRAPPTSKLVIQFDGQKATLKRGQLKGQTLQFVNDVLKEAGSPAASVAILNNNRVWFSKSTPSSTHQRIRNLLLH